MKFQPVQINCRGRLHVFRRPLVMGILNITPDSFYAGSRMADDSNLLRTAESMLKAGADVLDLGAQSTRPGAEMVGIDEEKRRLIPALCSIKSNFPDALISVDTFIGSVAADAAAAGADIINDVSAGEDDPEMLATVARLKLPYIAMHKQGVPATMQENPQYDDVLAEVLSDFAQKITDLASLGIHEVWIDPGFGFGKTPAHNFRLLQALEDFQVLGKPLLVGVSRKGMVWRTLGITAEEALNGSTVLHTVALLKGASILRVHDVKEAVEVRSLLEAMQSATA
ncbi:MAG: dihydropteroate synthase [Bacteroidia bacterium]